ncbi:MAG TPA: hypothetical protein VM509_08130 [Planctomycetota bacterium]|nr:hypothetical protein [Planctomycetota bacterium]
MSTCEKCGTEFQPQTGAEVVTTRVLCPACAKARAAEKSRAKAGASAGVRAAQSSSSATPVPALKPVPTSRPAVPQKPTVAPRPAVTAKPAATARPAVPQRAVAAPKSATPPPAAARRSASRASARDEEEEGGRPRLMTSSERDKRVMKFVWITAGLFAAGVAVVVMIVANKNENIRRAEEAEIAQQTQIIENLRKLSAEATGEAAATLISAAERDEALWKEKENASEITTLVARAKNQLEKDKQRVEIIGKMETLEKNLADGAKATPDPIAQWRRDLTDFEPGASLVGKDFEERVKKARLALNRAFAEALHLDAKTFATENPDKAKIALTRYTKAEDEIQNLLDETMKLRPKNPDLAAFYEGHFKDLIEESDALVTATYNEEAIKALPWKDLLSGEQAGFWNAAKTEGFSHVIQSGVLSIIGPDASAKSMGLISIGDREQWRDFVLEMEFTLETGKTTLYMRLGQHTQNTHTIDLKSGVDGIVEGKKYLLTLQMIGSKVTQTYYPEDIAPPEQELKWMVSRKGAIGLELGNGARLKISRMRVKELRSSTK